MKHKIFSQILFVFSTFIVLQNAMGQDDGAYLDAPYKRAHLETSASKESSLPLSFNLPKASDTLKLIALQTPVKAQGARGTCSIFSATALLESMLVIQQKFSTNLDLSEEWLEYVVTRNRSTDGSDSPSNFYALLEEGIPDEAVYPYIGQTWESVDSTYLAQERCGKLSGLDLASCLIGHRNPQLYDASDEQLSYPESSLYDPEFLAARTQAKSFMKNFSGLSTNEVYISPQQAKALLSQGIPVTVDLDFYYGAWNHRKGPDMGLVRDMDQWNRGVVGFPELGSLDRKVSLQDPAGHSVVLVGYDDKVTVTSNVQMVNGQVKKFSHKGVYYFKNSWGTTNFGKDFVLNGESHPGYGMMTQDYAHQFGGFFRISQ